MEKHELEAFDNYELERIAEYLKQLHFQPRLLGVDQADVWKKIAALDDLYEQAFRAERARYDRLLAKYTSVNPENQESKSNLERGDVYDENRPR